jgi:hypothetical protein
MTVVRIPGEGCPNEENYLKVSCLGCINNGHPCKYGELEYRRVA